MTKDRQTQKGGDNSQLIQAGTLNVVYAGIDEKRAREICAEMYNVARNELTIEAYACANERVQRLEDYLLPKMLQVEGALNAFSDPSFQSLLVSAQRTAAITEREADYNLLSELLMCRIEKGQPRKARTGISRAVEIVDKIDDDALCALTVIHAVNNVTPISGLCKSGIETLAELFDKLIYMPLPSGTDWIDHLDILGTIRVNMLGRFKKTKEYLAERLDGYSSVGIKVESDNYKKALELLSKVSLSRSILIPNEFLDGYVRLPVANKGHLEDLNVERTGQNDNGEACIVSRKISSKELSALKSIWELYETDNELKQSLDSSLMNEWDSHPSLNAVHIWWDSIPYSFSITQTGTVLAHTNAQRCDKTIPQLPL